MSTRSALLLTPESPYPAVGGGALRAASLLEYFTRRYRTDVATFREPGAAGPSFPPNLVRDVCVIDLPHHARNVVAKVVRNAGRLLRGVPPLVDRFSGHSETLAKFLAGRSYDIALAEHFWVAPYAAELAAASRKTILDLVDVESVLHARCAHVEPFPAAAAHRLFHQACLRLERRWLPRYSVLLATSEDDARALRDIAPRARVVVYPNTIPLVGQPEAPEEEAIAFSGNLEYHPNVTAVRFFRENIWPELREQWPALEWRLIGKNADGVAKHVEGDARIRCSGPVADAVAELARARVAVVPLLAGSGTRLKIVEAWAAGRAVVSTRVGAEGLPARNGGNIVLADGAREFTAAVSALLASPERRRAIGAAGRQTYERECTWPSAWSKLDGCGLCEP